MYKISLLFLLTLISLTSYAGWSTSSGEVTKVYSHNGAHIIQTTLTDNICNAGMFWWPADSSDAKDMFSLALSAFMAGKKIQVVYDPNNPECVAGYGGSTKITHMVITK